jgi:hypothetical protein
MLKTVFSVIAVVGSACCPVCVLGVEGDSLNKQAPVYSSVSDKETQERICRLIDEMLAAGHTNDQDRSRLRSGISAIAGQKLASVKPQEKGAVVREILGDERYKAFEAFLLAQMKAADFSERDGAVRALGLTLFSVASEAALKEAVFGGDRQIQVTALTSLAALGNTGAWDLSALVLMSRTVDDMTAAQVVKVLSSSDIHRLAECAPRVLAANDGPFTAVALFPALKLRKEFPDMVAMLFRSDRGRVPDTEKLTLEQHGRLNLETELLFEIELNPEHYLGDPAVRQKIEEYAKSKVHSLLYQISLRTFERFGREQAYFEELAKDTTNPQEKTVYLNRTIDHIKTGQRLKPEPPEAAKDE